MWSASINSIKQSPLWGHGVSNRFLALKENLPESFKYPDGKNFSHPHNDIFASAIGVGLIGGFLSVINLFSPLWAVLISKDYNETKLFLGSIITISIFSTANLNTIYFNDITSAWLAFATFLIWNVKFTGDINSVKD